MPSQAARQKAQATIIFQTIENSSALQNILTTSTTVHKKKIFISQHFITIPNAFSNHIETPPELFDILTIWFGKVKDALLRFPAVATAFKAWKQYFIDNHNMKLNFVHRIGLNWSSSLHSPTYSGNSNQIPGGFWIPVSQFSVIYFVVSFVVFFVVFFCSLFL